MSNTKADNYIESLTRYSEFELGGETYTIQDYDQYEVTTTNGDVFTWSDISEDYELRELENNADDQQDRGIQQNKI